MKYEVASLYKAQLHATKMPFRQEVFSLLRPVVATTQYIGVLEADQVLEKSCDIGQQY